MQDWKNNADLENGDDALNMHPLDQAFRRLLADAELAPDAHILDQMMGHLEEDDIEQKGPRSAQNQDAPVTPSLPASLTPVLKVRKMRRKLSFAAAIAGVLVVLAIGVREVSRPDSVVAVVTTTPVTPKALPENETATSRAADKEATSTAKPTENKGTATPNKTGADKTARLNGPANRITPKRKATSPVTGPQSTGDLAGTQRMKQAGVTEESKAGTLATSKAPAQASGLVVAKDLSPENDEIEKTGIAASSTQGAPLPKQKAGTVATDLPAAATGLTGLNREPEQNTRQIAKAVVAPGVSNAAGSKAGSEADPGRLSRAGKRRNRGLFKGLVDKLSATAQTISEDIVSQQDDKTVINIGVIAITTYK